LGEQSKYDKLDKFYDEMDNNSALGYNNNNAKE
jgi:hypothetical protein